MKLQKIPDDDSLVIARSVVKRTKLKIEVEGGKPRDVDVSSLTIAKRAQRGIKVIKRGGPILGLLKE